MTILTSASFMPALPAASELPRRARESRPDPVPSVPTALGEGRETATQLEQVQQAVERLKQSLKPALANTLEFQIDDNSGRPIVRIIDSETRALVRQIPSEEALSIARALDRMQGRGGLVRQEA